MSDNNGHAAACGAATFAIGAAVGAGLMLLLAPKSGRETRKELVRTLDDWRERSKDLLDQAVDLIRGRKAEEAAED